MNPFLHKTHLDYMQDYLERKESSTLPSWLKYLVFAEEVHQNFEHIDSLQELSENRVIQYVYRSLVILEKKERLFSQMKCIGNWRSSYRIVKRQKEELQNKERIGWKKAII